MCSVAKTHSSHLARRPPQAQGTLLLFWGRLRSTPRISITGERQLLKGALRAKGGSGFAPCCGASVNDLRPPLQNEDTQYQPPPHSCQLHLLLGFPHVMLGHQTPWPLPCSLPGSRTRGKLGPYCEDTVGPLERPEGEGPVGKSQLRRRPSSPILTSPTGSTAEPAKCSRASPALGCDESRYCQLPRRGDLLHSIRWLVPPPRVGCAGHVPAYKAHRAQHTRVWQRPLPPQDPIHTKPTEHLPQRGATGALAAA